MTKIIGIDLGTSNSVVAAVIGGRPVVLPDEEGARIQASVVSFLPDGKTLVGNKAKARASEDPVNTISSFKRLIGRPFYAPEIKVAQRHYPCRIERGPGNNTVIAVYDRSYAIEEISAMILKHMKKIAENYLGQEVEKAIITVPANFNDSQRHATKLAGELAGLQVTRIVNEPTSAALAYGYGEIKQEKVAVYDFGGGTFDITILDLRSNIYEVLSTAGNTYLGGDDFDHRLVNHIMAAFKEKYRYDLSTEISVRHRLKIISERLKCDLSHKQKVAVQISETIPGNNVPSAMSFSITREGFEENCRDIVQRSFIVCDEAIKLANLNVHLLDHLVLVGGTTRIPLVRKLAKDYFGLTPDVKINPDEVVAIGAAIYGDSLEKEYYRQPSDYEYATPPFSEEIVSLQPPTYQTSSTRAGNESNESNEQPFGSAEIAAAYSMPEEKNPFVPVGTLLLDVTPHSVGIKTLGGYMDVLIKRNSKIPIKERREFTTSVDYQKLVRLQIYEGEYNTVENNSKLGELLLSGITPARRGEVTIEVEFEIDTNGILNVLAKDAKTNAEQQVKLSIAGGWTEDTLADLHT